MSLSLIRPCADYERSYRAYIDELGSEERYPLPLDFAHDDFPALLQRLEDCERGIGLADGFVPSSTFWLVEDGELLGVSNLRHHLNDRIRHIGGHIGLGIRPGARGRGLGTWLMACTVEQARLRGMGVLHVHCHQHNAASARMILSNGGVLASEIEAGQPPEIVQRYVIAAGRPGAR